jgi:hypothetical protein
VISAIMREIDVAVFPSVAGGVGRRIVKYSGGVVCDCCTLMIDFHEIDDVG